MRDEDAGKDFGRFPNRKDWFAVGDYKKVQVESGIALANCFVHKIYWRKAERAFTHDFVNALLISNYCPNIDKCVPKCYN